MGIGRAFKLPASSCADFNPCVLPVPFCLASNSDTSPLPTRKIPIPTSGQRIELIFYVCRLQHGESCATVKHANTRGGIFKASWRRDGRCGVWKSNAKRDGRVNVWSRRDGAAVNESRNHSRGPEFSVELNNCGNVSLPMKFFFATVRASATLNTSR